MRPKQLVVKVSDRLDETIKRMAAQDDKTISEFVRDMLVKEAKRRGLWRVGMVR